MISLILLKLFSYFNAAPTCQILFPWLKDVLPQIDHFLTADMPKRVVKKKKTQIFFEILILGIFTC